MHSFIYDGDSAKDFVKGLGLAFTVPFQEELHNRHLRFAGEDGGVWDQPVQMLPGYRGQTGQEVSRLYQTQLDGRRLPNVADLAPQTRNALISVPVWGDARLEPARPEQLHHREAHHRRSSWLHVMDGHRAPALWRWAMSPAASPWG